MYVRTSQGLGQSAAIINLDRAVRQNSQLARWLGWQAHRDQIARHLGFSTTPDDQALAEAVARWQQGQGAAVDGIIGACTWSRMRTAFGIGPRLPCITRVNFRNGNGETSDPNNCCTSCPINLGVGQSGTASNSMELQFTISGHRPGIEYDIVRTGPGSLWERRSGNWTRLESFPMGTHDDRVDTDECLRPRGNRIFVIDQPGWTNITLPAPDGTNFPGVNPAVGTHADATDVVSLDGFTEWVIVRSRAESIPWTRISSPIFWHSITWLIRNTDNRWVLDRARSRIRRGALSSREINSAPT